MTTQVIFKIEEKLKKAAQEKARKEGISLSEFYKSATKSFVAGKIKVGIIVDEYTPNIKTSRILRQVHTNIKGGKTNSPQFKETKDAIHYLDRLN